MADVFTQAKRSEAVQVRSAEFEVPGDRCGSKFPEVELIAGDAEVFDNVGNDPARHVARMPGEGDQAVGTKRIGVMPMTTRSAQKFTTDFAESPLQLTAVPRGVLAHRSGGEDEFVAEGGRDGAAGFEQC